MLGTINPKKDNRKYMKKYYEERICKECKRIFYVHKKGRYSQRRPGNIRSRSSVTCSQKCSRKMRDNAYVPPERRNPLLDNKI